MPERQSITLQYGLLLVIIGGLITIMLWITTQFSDIRTTIKDSGWELRQRIVELEKKLELHIATTENKK